jgi:hypothetical protein
MRCGMSKLLGRSGFGLKLSQRTDEAGRGMNKRIAVNAPIAASLLAFLGAGTLSAAVVQYSSRTDWRTAAGGGTGDVTDDFNAGTLTRSAFTLTQDATGSIAAFPNSNAVNAIDGTGYLRLLLNSPTDFVTFTFSSPITALGYEVNPHSSTVGVVFSFAVNGTAAGSYSLPATDITEFRGFVSDTPFTTFTLTTAATDSRQGIDNLEAFTSVPEPAAATAGFSLAMLALGPLLGRRRCARRIH